MIIILENKKMRDNDINNKIENKENFITSINVEFSKIEKGKKIKYSDIIAAISHNRSMKNDKVNYTNNYSNNNNEEYTFNWFVIYFTCFFCKDGRR